MTTRGKVFLFVMGAILGVLLCMSMRGNEVAFSEIVYYLGFGLVDVSKGSIMEFLMSWFPLLFFQVWMGNYIYRHYCASSVYFFSRCTKRVQWYLKETVKLYVYALLYVGAMILGAWLYCNILYGVYWDELAGTLLIYFLLIDSLWLLVTTLFINIIGIIWDSSNGFMAIACIQFGTSALYGLLEEWLDFSEYTGIGKELQILVMKMIPVSNLVLKWHSGQIGDVEIPSALGFSYDFMVSVIVLLGMAAVAIGIGAVIVKKTDFVNNGRQL